MANTTIQLKRTTVSGRLPNTTNSSNTSYIAPGELAINLTDRKLVSSNGTVSFEIGSNVTSQYISDTLTFGNSGMIVANSSAGASGQILTSNGTSVYWAEPSSAQQVIKTFTYQIGANTTSITGADAAGQTLVYTLGSETVYLNGTKLVSANDYVTTNAYAVTLASNAVSGDVVQVQVFNTYMPLVLLDGNSNFTSSSTSAQIADSFDKTVYRSAKWLVQITDRTNNEYQASEVTLVHDGSTAYCIEYGTIYTGADALGVMSCNVGATNVNLIVTPTSANSVINTKRISIGV
jgi:hypothetical protein